MNVVAPEKVSPAAASEAAAAVPEPSRWRDFLRALAKVTALLVGTALALVAFVVVVPDGNDYAKATLMKHERLARPVAKKIVLVGGSNLAFGMDSAMIEQATGRLVVNMGMNGYFGVRFMLEEVKPQLKAGDTVVIALEYDSFFKSVDGTPTDLLMVAKNDSRALSHLTWQQRLAMAKVVPYVAQQKLLRLIRNAGHLFRTEQRGPLDMIETLAGFNQYGDLESHLGVDWNAELENGIDLTRTPMDGEVIGLLRDFAAEMKGRSVQVIVSYTPAIEYYYAAHKRSIDHLHELMTEGGSLVVPSPPTDFVFPRRLFFDTVYHVNREGRALRTQKVIRDIQRN